jgi:hypothetical protein
LVFVDVDLNVIVVFLILLSNHVTLHHVVLVLAHVLLLLVLELHVFFAVLHVLLVDHLVVFFHVLDIVITFLILAFVDDLGLIVLILLLLDQHLIMLVKGHSLVALHAFIILVHVVFVLDLALSLIADFTLFIHLVHVGISLVVLLILVLALGSLVITHLHLQRLTLGEVGGSQIELIVVLGRVEQLALLFGDVRGGVHVCILQDMYVTLQLFDLL